VLILPFILLAAVVIFADLSSWNLDSRMEELLYVQNEGQEINTVRTPSENQALEVRLPEEISEEATQEDVLDAISRIYSKENHNNGQG
jgi:hypothetical protein